MNLCSPVEVVIDSGSIGSPFAPFDREAADKPAGLGDVLLALFILSRPANAAADGIGGVWFQLLTWYWSFRFRVEVALCPAKVFAVPAASSQLAHFIGRSCRGPRLWEESAGDGRRRGSPALATIKANLMRLGFSDGDALVMPVKRALWECSVWWEMQGTARIDTEDLDALTAQVKAELAASKAN